MVSTWEVDKYKYFFFCCCLALLLNWIVGWVKENIVWVEIDPRIVFVKDNLFHVPRFPVFFLLCGGRAGKKKN